MSVKSSSLEPEVSGNKRRKLDYDSSATADFTRTTTTTSGRMDLTMEKKESQLDESSSLPHTTSGLTSPNTKSEVTSPLATKSAGPEAIPQADDQNKQNAFQKLMAPKAALPIAAQQPSLPSKSRLPNPNSRGKGYLRDGLGLYTSNPKNIPKELRLYETKDFVAIRDLYPKSAVHTLLLFKTSKNVLHPFHLLQDPELLAMARQEAQKLRQFVGKELQRNFGKFSAQDRRRQQVLNGEITVADDDDLPEGRDWEKEVLVGVHARPSMNHCHIHVLSPDRVSECMKKRNHYQSFSSRFFVNLDEFPLAEDDPRWDSHNTNEYLKDDFLCWRCKTRFKKFSDLKRHLDEEFGEWMAE